MFICWENMINIGLICYRSPFSTGKIILILGLTESGRKKDICIYCNLTANCFMVHSCYDSSEYLNFPVHIWYSIHKMTFIRILFGFPFSKASFLIVHRVLLGFLQLCYYIIFVNIELHKVL